MVGSIRPPKDNGAVWMCLFSIYTSIHSVFVAYHQQQHQQKAAATKKSESEWKKKNSTMYGK